WGPFFQFSRTLAKSGAVTRTSVSSGNSFSGGRIAALARSANAKHKEEARRNVVLISRATVAIFIPVRLSGELPNRLEHAKSEGFQYPTGQECQQPSFLFLFLDNCLLCATRGFEITVGVTGIIVRVSEGVAMVQKVLHRF